MQGPKIWLLASALAMAGAFTLNSTPVEARPPVVTIYATTAPPPLRTERMPPPRRGYVWAPGYWNWAHNRYVWQAGHWERARRGYHYAPPRWTPEGKRWRYYGGGWRR